MVSFKVLLAKAIAKINGAPVANPPPKIEEGSQQPKPLLDRAANHVPIRGAYRIAVAAGKVAGAAASPLPVVGPAVELVESIVEVCKKVSVNKLAARKLGDHCQDLLNTIKQPLDDERQWEQMRQSRLDFQQLLLDIDKDVRKWADLKWTVAFKKQEAIAEDIRLYHVKMDDLCQRHELTLITKISNWQEEHRKQSQQDYDDLRHLIIQSSHGQDINFSNLSEQIYRLHEEFTTFNQFAHVHLSHSSKDPADSASVNSLVVDAMSSRIPWITPIAKLVESIAKLCKGVPRNKNTAVGLGIHCCALVHTLLREQDDYGWKQEEIERLFRQIKHDVNAWRTMKWIEAIGKQKSISEKIWEYHSQISNSCHSHEMTLLTEISDWLQEHSERVVSDEEELKAKLIDPGLAREIESNCRMSKIAGFNADLMMFYAQIQDLLLEYTRQTHFLGYSSTTGYDRLADERKALETNLSAIYLTTGVLPPNLELTESLAQMERFPIAGSSMYDVFRGTCFGDPGCMCAFKVVRHIKANAGTKTRQKLDEQLKHWRSIQMKVNHARQNKQNIYILPLIGVIYRENTERPLLCFISPWMANGNAFDYVRRSEGIDKLDLVRKIALGISVLHDHEPPIPHGNIRASNVLMDARGEPYISDVGIMRVLDEEDRRSAGTVSLENALSSTRWFPPEYLGSDYLERPVSENSDEPSTKSDIFMLGMTILEIMTGQKPFSTIRRDMEMLIRRMNGELPAKPQNFDHSLWTLLQGCWARSPKDRPGIHEVIRALDDISS